MRLLFLVALLALPAGLAQAGVDPGFVSGVWTGTGVLQMENKITGCQDVTMRFVASPASYRFAGASFKCGDATQEFQEASAYDIHDDGKIYFRDTHVGYVEDNLIHIDNPVAINNKMSDNYTVIRRGDILLFTEAMGLPGVTPWFSFVAILKAAPNPPAP